MAAVVPYSTALLATNSFWAHISIWYDPLLPISPSTVVSITLATCSFAEAIAIGEIDELHGPVGSGKTLAEERDLLSTRLKYFRIDMTITSWQRDQRFHTLGLTPGSPPSWYTCQLVFFTHEMI